MFRDYQELETLRLVGSIDLDTTDNITLARHNFSQEITDDPGVAIINPQNKAYREMIAFSGIAEWNHSLVLKGVVRAIETGAFYHSAGMEVYLDQGEQYKNITENSRKEILKRCLRTLR